VIALVGMAMIGTIAVDAARLATFPTSIVFKEGIQSMNFMLSMLKDPTNISVAAEWQVTITASLEGVNRTDTVTKPSEITRPALGDPGQGGAPRT